MFKKDIRGWKDNGLFVVAYDSDGKWLTKYSCGHTKLCTPREIRNNVSGLCSTCLKSKKAVEMNTSHNMSKTPTYKSWLAMRSRCLDPKNNKYASYGKQGVTVCDRWLNSFENFLEDMGTRPSRHSLERLDNGLGYSPDNCIWANTIEQANNKSNVSLITDGEQMWSLKRWCEILNLDYKRCWYLIKKKGLSVSAVLGEEYRYL